MRYPMAIEEGPDKKDLLTHLFFEIKKREYIIEQMKIIDEEDKKE
jgi:hypothetical protein